MGFLSLLLLPVAWLYGFIMWVRNLLFDSGILRQVEFDIPIISVGNLSLGGTGKTPHTEYLVRLLKDIYCVATLSRGYGRETRGFLLAPRRTNAKYIGDEPMQYSRKFPGIRVAVDEKRRRGVRNLIEKVPGLEVILLDDAFQHRWVRPGLSIVLTDYHHLYFEDHVVPSGRLREFPRGIKRADIIVVSKTPRILSPITRRRILEQMKTTEKQQVFFSFISYAPPVPVFDYPANAFPVKPGYILLFTGIAHDYPLKEQLERECRDLVMVKYPDHYPYSLKDAEELKKRFDDLPGSKKVLVTTEKDAMRLRAVDAANIFKNVPLFYIPIEVDFHGQDRENFNKAVLSYVGQSKLRK